MARGRSDKAEGPVYEIYLAGDARQVCRSASVKQKA